MFGITPYLILQFKEFDTMFGFKSLKITTHLRKNLYHKINQFVHI